MMRGRRALLAVAVLAIPLWPLLAARRSGPLAAPLQSPGTTTRVSVASDGTQGDGASKWPSISADGLYVAFQSHATNLVAGDTNGYDEDVFVHDRQTGQTTRVSVASDGTEGSSSSQYPSISADGRYVAFESYATNLVPDHWYGYDDVFVHDRQTGHTTLVSVASVGGEANGDSYRPSISGDGRYVAFESLATDLVLGDTNGKRDIFVHDRQTGQTTLVSVASNGTQGNGTSRYPSISADGRYVAFYSAASNLVTGDDNGKADIFVHDQQTGQTTRVSVASDGTQGDGSSSSPSISADGRYVAFQSDASNLVPADSNYRRDVFVHDRQTGQTTLVSVASDGTQANSDSYVPSISADGRYVAFQSYANILVPADTNLYDDIFVHDRATGLTARVSVTSDGLQGDVASEYPSISADGRYVTFHSVATNLVPDDTNGQADVFVHDTHEPDTDEDGLPDRWEQNGIDTNGDGTVDLNLPAMGADPMHKDIFVEVDFMEHHRPNASAIQDVIDAFANAPVSNPDGVDGITLHVIVDEEITHQNSIDLWADFDTLKDAHFGTSAERSSANWNNIRQARRMVFRYALFVHQYNPSPYAGGIAERPGNDFILSFGAWTSIGGHNVGSRDEQAGTFMHELGHTLNLRHGGGDATNCKPNYLSIMSYSRQLSDIITDRPLDYSRSELPTLKENPLDETLGIQGPANWSTTYGPPRDTDSDGDLDYLTVAADGAIDWDGDGTIENSVQANINNLGFWGCNEADAAQTLTGYDDWGNLLYDFRGTPGFAGGVHLQVAEDEITWEVVEEIREVAETSQNIYLPLILRNY